MGDKRQISPQPPLKIPLNPPFKGGFRGIEMYRPTAKTAVVGVWSPNPYRTQEKLRESWGNEKAAIYRLMSRQLPPLKPGC